MKDTKMSEDRKQTEGEYRVGVSFNPSNSSAVDEIKRKTAELIDLIELHWCMQKHLTKGDFVGLQLNESLLAFIEAGKPKSK